MSILIKGMEMPKSCFECPFMLRRCFCLVNPRIEFTDEEYSELKGRYGGCPLVSVPPHGRLIAREKMLDAIRLELAQANAANDMEDYDAWMRVFDFVRKFPTIIPAEEGER